MTRIMKTEYVCTYLHWLVSTLDKLKKRHFNVTLHQISEKLSTLRGATIRTWCILLEVRTVLGIVPASLHLISKLIVPVCGVRLFLVQEFFFKYFISIWKKEHITTSITVRFQEVLYARFCCCCCFVVIVVLFWFDFVFVFVFVFIVLLYASISSWTQYANILEANIPLSA